MSVQFTIRRALVAAVASLTALGAGLSAAPAQAAAPVSQAPTQAQAPTQSPAPRSAACRSELASTLGKQFRGVVARRYSQGRIGLYRNSSGTWAICDSWRAYGRVTLTGGRKTNNRHRVASYQIATQLVPKQQQYFAAGPKLRGVRSITYRFSDGHTQRAVIGKKMWFMVYLHQGRSNVDSARVRVVMHNGDVRRFRLADADGMCAQLNHGC